MVVDYRHGGRCCRILLRGHEYGETKTTKTATGATSAYAGGTGRRTGGAGFGAGGTTPVIGTILSNSNGIYTISIASGGSKNVLVGSSTTITKSTAGTTADLANGTNVIVTGTTDSSGNVDATGIQIRPAGATGGFGGGAGAGSGSASPTPTPAAAQ